jgi:hypothetical protein
MLQKTLLRRFSALATCLALAGCCANDTCDCQDYLADALLFRFNYTPRRRLDANGKPISFNAKDIDTIRIYRRSIIPPTLRDTIGFVRQTDSVTVVRQLDTQTSPGDTLIATQVLSTSTNNVTTTLKDQDLIVINNASPFSSRASIKLDSYTYRIGVLRSRAGRRKPSPLYYITNIQLQGRYNADGCCTCYENTAKAYTLTIGATATTAPRVQQINAAAPDSANGYRVVRLPFPL